MTLDFITQRGELRDLVRQADVVLAAGLPVRRLALYEPPFVIDDGHPAPPAGFAGKPWAADLHFAPDGRHLYASERTTSTIAVYEVDAANGQLKTLASVPTEKTPRGFAIDPSGRYLVASGQESHAIAVYAIDPASGALAPLQRYTVGKNPNWVEIVELP